MADHGNITTPNGGDLNTAARQYLASVGRALPDGSYPIRKRENHGLADLDNAIHAIGRSSHSTATVKRYIIKRARALNSMGHLPDAWRAALRSHGGH